MIRLIVDNVSIQVTQLTFSDGATTFKLIDMPTHCKTVWVTVDPSTPVCMILNEIVLIHSAITSSISDDCKPFIGLNIPYCPYGRADRVFEFGNPLPLVAFFDAIHHLFDEIITTDMHNQFWSNAYKITEFPQHRALQHVLNDRLFDYDYVVAPDKGALKKIYELTMPTITATKIRDITTGRITDTILDVEEDLTGCKLLIVDDICDGGGTFIPLAEKLRSLGASVDLYVTHLIAAKGLDIFKNKIDNVFCYHVVGSYINATDVTKFNLIPKI
ncbi:ribose-phosphate pyrophosphokinase [Alishewanella phage vB_AspM_Slicko01]|nr:ribose-phosphate pyrophosphokinase [Alishewanella phage vB_AspM_Slicko01]